MKEKCMKAIPNAKDTSHLKQTIIPGNHETIDTRWMRDGGAPVYGAPSNIASKDNQAKECFNILTNRGKSGKESVQSHEILRKKGQTHAKIQMGQAKTS